VHTNIATTPRHPAAANAVLGAAATFVLLVLALHVVQAELAPSASMLSQYALGRGAFLMAIAFLALSATYVALLVGLHAELRGIWGRLGQLALLLAAIGSAMGGLFPMDPVDTPPEQYSLSGKLHGVAFMLGGPGALLSATFVNIALARLPAWRPAKRGLVMTAAVVWIVYIAFSVVIVQLMGGSEAATHWAGWLNRALVLSWLVWSCHLAWHLRRRAA
jgi:hypothetical protein